MNNNKPLVDLIEGALYTEKGEERERAFINLYNNIEYRLSSSLKGSGALGRPSNALHPSKGDYLVIEAFIPHQRMFIKAQTDTNKHKNRPNSTITRFLNY